MAKLSLAELIDLELRILRDEDEPEDGLRRRDREIGRRLVDKEGVDPQDRVGLLQGLLGRVRKSPSPGERVASSVAWIQGILTALALLLGWGVAVELLDYKGEHPVNVVHFLAVLVGLQILLLVLLIIALVPRRREMWFPGRGPLQAALHALLNRMIRSEEVRDVLHRLRLRRGEYRALERWLLLRATQTFGVAFNLGALAGCLYRILFSDVAFGWSTTLQWDAAGFHTLVSNLSLPWAWLIPAAHPSLELVELTRYSHLEGRYILSGNGRALDPAMVGGWWRFLILSVAVYGLLPRLAALALASLQVRKNLVRAPHEAERFRRIHERMVRPLVEYHTDESGTEPFKPPQEQTIDHPPLPGEGTSCVVILCESLQIDREDLTELVRKRFGWDVSNVLRPDETAQVSSSEGPILVAAPAWEEPIRAYQRLVRDLREKAGDRRSIIFGLLDEGEDGGWAAPLETKRKRWKRHMETGEDPGFRVESLGGPA